MCSCHFKLSLNEKFTELRLADQGSPNDGFNRRTDHNPNSSTHGRPSKQTESSETRVTSEKSFGSTSGIVSNAQILQRFLSFYVLELCDWALYWISKDKMYIFFKTKFFLKRCSDLGQFFLLSNCSRPRANESQTAIFVAKQCSFADIGFGFGLPCSRPRAFDERLCKLFVSAEKTPFKEEP